ncbi:hypothetical protein FB45DRAFT_889334 [Roridomyces roridus]|uniref:Uncharacterized protein n=1 Tax=Roridomyces roridus TaxID=1738132 RepID=A0AAD7CKC9_9AGAR|nr:hypothetical protein FB45DRAFT_889334 [Roridomyces roridus]
MVASPANCPSNLWTLDTTGWIFNLHGDRLFWWPPELLHTLNAPPCILIIGKYGQVNLEFDLSCLGSNWANCYSEEAEEISDN